MPHSEVQGNLQGLQESLQTLSWCQHLTVALGAAILVKGGEGILEFDTMAPMCSGH